LHDICTGIRDDVIKIPVFQASLVLHGTRKSASVAAREEPEFLYTIFSDTGTGVIIPSQALF
jgi:hypothetical protein